MQYRSSYFVISILLISSFLGITLFVTNTGTNFDRSSLDDQSDPLSDSKINSYNQEISVIVDELSDSPIIGKLIQTSNILKFELNNFSNFKTNHIKPNLIISSLKDKGIFVDVIRLNGADDNIIKYDPGTWQTPIEITNSINVLIENNTIVLNDIMTSANYAIRVDDVSNNVTIRNNEITIDDTFAEDLTGIEIVGSGEISIYNNTIHKITTTAGFVLGISIDSSPSTNVSYNSINELSGTSGASAIKITNSANSLIYGNTIDNNQASLTIDSSFTGIDAVSDGMNISSNIIRNVKSNNSIITIALTSSDARIINNSISNIYSLKSKIIGFDSLDSNNLIFSNNTLNTLTSSGTGFDFANEKSVYGVRLKTSHNYLLYNNTVTSLTSESNIFGVEVTSSFPGNISSNRLTTFTGDTIYGITVNTPSLTTTISDNILDNYSGKSIRALYSANSVANVLRNEITNSDSQTLSTLFEIVNGTNSQIINNTISNHDSASSFFTVYGVKILASDGVLIQGNEVSQLSTNLVGIVGIDIYDSDNLSILNNTISDINTGTNYAVAINIDKTSSTIIKFNDIRNLQGSILTIFSSSLKLSFETQALSDLSYAIQLQHASFVVIENNVITSVSLWLKSDEGNTDITYSGNEIDGQQIALIAFDRPEDLIIGFDDTNRTISWLANTNPTDESFGYEIFLNGNLVSTGSWFSSLRIFYLLENLTDGVNSIELILTQTNGVKITDSVTITVTELTLPSLISIQDDIRMVVGNTEKQLKWVATDVNPGTYNLLRNGSSVAFGAWENNSEIVFTLANLPVGIYNFSIIITDNTGNSISDTVIVTILDLFEIFFSITPSNVWFTFNETGNELVWQVESVESGNYIIKQDGIDVLNGEWDPSQEIIYELGILDIGEYVFSILVIDDAGNDLTNEVIVQILAPEEIQTSDDDGKFDFLTEVDTDLTSIRENLIPFIIFAGTLSAIVVSVYLYKRRAKIRGVAGKIGSKAKKTAFKAGGKAKSTVTSKKKTGKKDSKKKKSKKGKK